MNNLHKLFEKYTVTEEKVKEMESTVLIWNDVIAKGHISVIAGYSGSGKTTVITQFAEDCALNGYDVFYLQEDAAAGELIGMREHAARAGYQLLNSTLSGEDAESIVKMLYAAIEEKLDLTNTILIFDTLKKFNDIMSKGSSRKFFKVMRSLTVLGATVVILAHTNKYEKSGVPIFEGVGDVRNDVDELIYIRSTEPDDNGMITMSLNHDKQRSFAKPKSFKFNKNTRELTASSEVINVTDQLEIKMQLEKDSEIIECIKDFLGEGEHKIGDLVDKVQSILPVGSSKIRSCIQRWSDKGIQPGKPLWITERTSAYNALYVKIT